MTAPHKSNQKILAEADAGRLWFHARKTRPIWAKQLDRPQRVQTIEGTEQVPAGTYLCRGEAGDTWPQAPDRLADKYEAIDEIDADGWQKYRPRPDGQGVMAAQIPHAFTVEAQWGLLRGKAGDYLVKNYAYRDVADPKDVWIVDQQLFAATYERTEE